MSNFTILLSQILLGWLVIQVLLILVFLWYLHSHPKYSLPDDQLPKTAVVLCLRGADPFLPNCLRSLLNQNYPQYDLKLIIDSPADPASKIAKDILQEQQATNVQISFLTQVRHNCSLKCSSLIQAVSELDTSYEVVAIVDADTIPHSDWLRELVSPLKNPKIAATTGNRWYLPTGKSWGSLVRYIWNISAVVQMYLYGIPWGGTLAIKTQVIHQTKLLEKWGQGFGEDTMLPSIFKKHKLQIKFVPSLIMLNQEECNLPSLRNWLKRQLLSSRLYHPWWSAVVGDMILTILFPTLVLVTFLAALFSQQWNTALFYFSCYSGYILALLLIVLLLESQIQKRITQKLITHHGEPKTKLSATTVMKMLIAIPVTQWVYASAMLSALWMSTVTWRGITYRVQNPWNIHLLEYHPYQPLDQPIDPQVSL